MHQNQSDKLTGANNFSSNAHFLPKTSDQLHIHYAKRIGKEYKF